MLSYLLRQLTNSFGIFFRTIRAFFTRKLVGAWSYLGRITNFSRHATKVATASFQGAAAAVQKPTKREDYIETQRLFISKSFLILLAAGLIVAGLLIYFIIWPFLLSHFFTAKFYQNDSKLDTWSGRVIVYYDEEKTQPMYRGTLEEGLLQGKGEEYDEDGLLTYAGNFVDGLHSGNGSLYEAGVLVYEGQFSNGEINGMGVAYTDGVICYQGAFVEGVYEGSGTAYYPSGAKAYTGSFSAGLYEGEGTEYHENGKVRYKGTFSEGVYSGEGTEYGENGQLRYKGAYVNGLYEGEGTEYDEDGRMCYKGTFSAGLYEGSGTLYLDTGDQIQAEFAAGVSTGTIQWYHGGRLWYDGGADDLTPDGFGTLYLENGKVIYAGDFDQGTLDGAWLLTLTAAELREAFGDAALTESDGESGFLIVNEALGLSALCSYQQEGEEAQVYRLWFAPDEDSMCRTLLPWENGSQAAAWAMTGRETRPEESLFQGAILQPDGTVGGDWYQRQYRYEDYTCTLLSETSQDSAPSLVCWSRDMSDPGGGTIVDEGTAQAQERLDALLAALDGAGGSGSSGGGSASAEDVERLLGLMLTVQDGEDLMDAMIDYHVYGQMAQSLEASQPLLQQQLAEAQTKLQKGEGTQEAVDDAQSALDSLDRRLAQYRTAKEQASLTIQDLSKMEPDDYDLSAVLLSFDPVELDSASLYDAALAYAQERDGKKNVDADALSREIKSAVLELGLSYEAIRSARTTAEDAAAQVETITQAYAKGTADKAALYSAQCAQNEAIASLYQAMGTFAHQANGLNTLSGGWLAEEYDWLADTFAALFQSELLQNEETAPEGDDETGAEEETPQEGTEDRPAGEDQQPGTAESGEN